MNALSVLPVLPILFLLCARGASLAVAEPEAAPASGAIAAFAEERIMPQGARYEVLVPDTLDLAERARLAVHALAESLNPDRGYAPYGHAFFKVQPPYMSERMYAPRMDAGTANWGKVMEALVLMRSVSGARLDLERQARSLAGMLRYASESGCPYQNSRALMAMMELYRERPGDDLRILIERQMHRLDLPRDGPDASVCYEDPEPNLNPSDLGVANYETQTHQHGGPLWALCQWHALARSPQDLETASRLSRFLVQPRFWQPEAEPRFFAGAERAHFSGHVHSYLGALLGLLEYARITNDAWLKEFVRNGYEHIRNQGIARLGAFGETCVIGEMTILAAELSEAGVGEYWDHVDQYARNHLAEMQCVDGQGMESRVRQMPTLETLPRTPIDGDVFQTQADAAPGRDSSTRVLERNLGAFFTDGGHPAKIPRRNWSWTICCVANGAKGLYYAWSSIVRGSEDNARVNLLLNRASELLDVDSYLPYEGKVVIRNKTARRISVRIPQWVDKHAVHCTVGARVGAPYWLGNYLVFERMSPSEVVTLRFPLVEATEVYTLKWKQDDRWFESNWAPNEWKPGQDRYECRFRGNTAVWVLPVPRTVTDGPGYPLYLRVHLLATNAPMRRVTRFVRTSPPQP